ncbi:MCE family protein [Mycobacterium sp. 663a-19]|uniref:MCE family protein n=1 Tax=Mycobacterium sp. 663a-19 TaxID=2986148 RepID=UPI002D1E6BE0|nr:MCE family protein [Mycobacterium sp. 663a-19]MEB3980121.1 MCE family protein [Mycobacterium sp. 663a-19]
MAGKAKRFRVHPAFWTAALFAVVLAFVWLCSALFAGTLNTYVPVTLTSDRAGLVMESGAKVKLRGVQVGRVAGIEGGNPVRLKLDLFPDQIKHIPANIDAQIRATTLFGAKYVDLVYPESPSRQHISAGAVLRSRNVTTEVNTVFENLVNVLHQIDPPKLNAVLTAFADAVRGRGERIGDSITASNHVLGEINPRMATLQHDWQSLGEASRAYGGAAQNLLEIVRAFTTTSATITAHASDLDILLLNVIGVSQAGIDLLAPNRDNLVRAVNVLQPTTDLLFKYNPEYTCLLVGAKGWLDNGGYNVAGAQNGRSILLDDAFLLGGDPYRYPDNLPIVAAKGGPGGKPGCGSLPDVAANYPVRQLVTNTGWGTGLDLRPNPGIGFPGWANFFPVTRGTPEPPSIRYFGPPAPGPVPYPGAPPYGAPVAGPSDAPLNPPPPGQPVPSP